MTNQSERDCVTQTQANIIYEARFFWRQIVYWTRAFLNSSFNGIGNVDETFARLYAIPLPFAQMLQLILGRSFRDRFVSQMTGYMIILKELVDAVLTGQADLVNQKVNELGRYAEERAEFLAETFPTLDKDVLVEMITAFHNYEIEEMNAYITRDYTRLVEVYDNLIIQAEKMADYFSKGIIDLITAAPAPGVEAGQDPDTCVTYDQLDIIIDIAMTWIDLVTWFRVYRVSLMAGVGDTEVLFDRLLQVPVEFGNKIRAFVDDETVDRQVHLMQEYLSIISRLLSARMVNDIDEMNLAFQQALDNINERAALLSSVFPALDEEEWGGRLFRMHSTLMDMGGAFLAGDFAENIRLFDGLISQAEDLGSYFVESLFDIVIPPSS